MKKYSAIIKKSGNQYLALCLELGVVGCGTSPRSAKKSLLNAIESYLEYVHDEGLHEDRTVSIKELHEFLYYNDIFKKSKNQQSREPEISLKLMRYA